MPIKPKIAFFWCSSCGGCEESIIDLAEDLLALTAKIDIVFWPVATDHKRRHIEALADGEILATLVNGAVRMTEQGEMARLLRRKSQFIIAHGTCAHLGGIVGLANFFDRKDVLERSFLEVPTLANPANVVPQPVSYDGDRELHLSAFDETVKALDQVVPVDYYIPGCPPTPELIQRALDDLLANRLPVRGSVLADSHALCHTCARVESRPTRLNLKGFKRLYALKWDSEGCFLNQGIICLGPATRGGCGSRCIGANMPCRGCFGPIGPVRDQGAKIMAFLASLLQDCDPGEIETLADTIADPGGLFYRYSLPSSILKKKR